MKFEQQGEWSVSTPIYIGDVVAVSAAQRCGHKFEETLRKVDVDPATGKKIDMVMEKCKSCVATRCKWRFHHD